MPVSGSPANHIRGYCRGADSRRELYLFVAIDRTSKFAFVDLSSKAGKMNAAQFLRNLIAAVPYEFICNSGLQNQIVSS